MIVMMMMMMMMMNYRGTKVALDPCEAGVQEPHGAHTVLWDHENSVDLISKSLQVHQVATVISLTKVAT